MTDRIIPPAPRVMRLDDGTIALRVYRDSQSEPVEVVLDPTEALGLAIDLTNKTRVQIEIAASRSR